MLKLGFGPLFKGSRGFSLMEIMIGGAIIAGVGLAAATLFRDQKVAQKKVEHEATLSQFHQTLVKQLSDDNNCNATLSSFYNQASVGATDISTIVFCNDPNPAAPDECANPNITADPTTLPGTDSYIAEGEWIDDVNAPDNKQIWTLTTISFPAALGTTGTLQVNFDYTLNPLKFGPNRVIRKVARLNLRFSGNPARFQECINNQRSSFNNLQKDLCDTLMPTIPSTGASPGELMQWNDSTQKCETVGEAAAPVKNCDADPTLGLTVEGIRSDGTVHCRPVTQGFDPDPLIHPGQTNCAAGDNAKLEWVGGKLRIVCTP